MNQAHLQEPQRYQELPGGMPRLRQPPSFLGTILSRKTLLVIGLLSLLSFLIVGFYTNWSYQWPKERERRS
jgi:hypothetical protein